MKTKLRAPVSTAVAMGSGILLLLTYAFALDSIRATMLGWVVLATAAALIMGMLNLATVHVNKIRGGTRNALYSFVLVVMMFLTFAITLAQGAEGEFSRWLFEFVQIPVESSLMAVMAVTLTYASSNLLNRRPDLFSIVFFTVLIFTLLGIGPIFGFNIPLLSDTIQPWITRVLAGAGARGLLIGVALGTIATGLRVLMGVDRPFGG